MTAKPVQPGDTVWTLNRYTNTVYQATVSRVESGGVYFKNEPYYPASFASVFDNKNDAEWALIAKAQADVKKQRDELKNAERRLASLTKKLGLVPSTSPTTEAMGASGH
jgi:hypothetical protein